MLHGAIDTSGQYLQLRVAVGLDGPRSGRPPSVQRPRRGRRQEARPTVRSRAQVSGPAPTDAPPRPHRQMPTSVTLRAAHWSSSPKGRVDLTDCSPAAAPDLAHHPGQLVFPGGAADPGDRGAVDTARAKHERRSASRPAAEEAPPRRPLSVPGRSARVIFGCRAASPRGPPQRGLVEWTWEAQHEGRALMPTG